MRIVCQHVPILDTSKHGILHTVETQMFYLCDLSSGSALVARNKTILKDRNTSFGPRRETTCLQGFAKIKGSDQPEHRRSLISAFVIPTLESIISRLATSEISLF